MKISRNHILIGVAIVIVILAVFWPVFGYGFVPWDDNILVYENPRYSPPTPRSILPFWLSEYEGLYMPLTYTIWGIEALAPHTPTDDSPGGHLNPHVFHIVNVVLHVLGALAVFGTLRMLIGRRTPSADHEGALGFPKRDLAAGIGALLFAVHPIQVEPVAWVTGLKDTLAGVMSVVAVWQYVRYAGRKASGARSGARNYAFATLAFVLALLAKPNAVVIPAAAWVIDVWVVGRSFRRATMSIAPWMALAVPWMFLAKSIQPDSHVRIVTPLWTRPVIMGDTVAFYLAKVVFPLLLGPDYGRAPDAVLRHGWVYATCLVPVLVAVLLLLRKDHTLWLSSFGVFVVALLPVSGLVPFVFQNFSTVADRYLYVSMLGPSLALASFVYYHGAARTAAVCSLVLCVFGVLAGIQVRYWESQATLFEHALRVNPKSYMAHNNVALVLMGQGKPEEAVRHLRKALKIDPAYPKTHSNLGYALSALGRHDEAIKEYKEAIRLKPDLEQAHYNLGTTLAELGRMDEAVRHLSAAVRIRPDYPEAYNNLGLVLVGQGKPREAVREYEKALRTNPDFADARCNLGNALAAQGKHEAAIREYRAAVRLEPGHPQASDRLAAAHFRLAGTYAKQGKTDKAIEELEEAVRLKPSDINMRAVLAGALMSRRRMAEAVSEYEAIVRIKPDMAAAHNNMAVALFFMKEFPRAKDELALARKYGAKPNPGFAKALEQAGGQ